MNIKWGRRGGRGDCLDQMPEGGEKTTKILNQICNSKNSSRWILNGDRSSL